MAVLVALVFLSFQKAESVIILDQSQMFTDKTAARASSTLTICQTFTAGYSGYLSLVSLWLSEAVSANQQAPATIRILETTASYIPNSSNILWEKSFDHLAQGWYDVDTSMGAPLITAGNVYGIEFSSTDSAVGNPDNKWYAIGTSAPQHDIDTYISGQLFENRGDGWNIWSSGGISYPNVDAAFKTSLVAVPEPSNIIFLGTLLILPLFHRVRK